MIPKSGTATNFPQARRRLAGQLAELISFTAWLGNLCGVSEKEADAHRGLRHLRRLGLASTPLTDGDLGHLAELKILEELDLEGTRTTFEGRKKLREALPNCRIIDQRPAVRLSDPRR